jgi:hypothetical protein
MMKTNTPNNELLSTCASCGKESRGRAATMCNKCVTSLLMSEPLPSNIMDDSTDNVDSKEIATCTSDNNGSNIATICANCGKEGAEDSMNTCNKCDLVLYCNAACKKKHRSKHKKKCEKQATELHDEQLFKEPPPPEECPICMLPPPLNDNHITGMTFHSCCGKRICNGCIFAMKETGRKNMTLCPFCKTPPPWTEAENVERIKKLMEKGNANAFFTLAGCYSKGISGVPQNWAKANELLLKAGELGSAEAYNDLGYSYYNGDGVAVDMKKAKHYYELAAMGGSVPARYNLGANEYEAGNYQRAYKHCIIAASMGDDDSLKAVKSGYMDGHVTKDQYTNTLREYQKSQDEMKSDMRDKAACIS